MGWIGQVPVRMDRAGTGWDGQGEYWLGWTRRVLVGMDRMGAGWDGQGRCWLE